MVETLAGELRELMAEVGLACEESVAEQLVRHLLLVIEKNKVVNLTRITDVHEALVLHVVDSLLPILCERGHLELGMSFVDMGTGAGFPGLPLAIYTGADGTLVDSVGKKVNAVNEFCEQLGIGNAHAVHARVEDLARELRGTQDFVIARAMARANVLVEYATPLLKKKKGILCVEKARPDDEEVAEAQRAAKVCGLRLVEQRSFELPRELGHREIFFFEKFAQARIKLPRKAGEALRNPLGLSE